MTEEAPKFSPDAEKALDAVIDQIMGGPDVDDDEDALEEGAGEDEQPQPKAGETEEDDEEESPSPATQDADAEWKNAREKLQYAGYSKAYLDSLDRAQTIEAWSQRSPREAEIQRAFRERAELQKRIEELEATRRAEHGEPTAAPDLSALETRAVEELGDLGKDLVAALRQSQAKSAPSELQEQLAASTAMLQDLIRERARAELGKRFPLLRKDPDVYDKTETLASELGQTSLHPGTHGVDRYVALMSTAASLLGLEPEKPEPDREEREMKGRQRDKGTPSRGKTAEPKPRTQAELLDAKIRFIQSNPKATAGDVLRHFGG